VASVSAPDGSCSAGRCWPSLPRHAPGGAHGENRGSGLPRARHRGRRVATTHAGLSEPRKHTRRGLRLLEAVLPVQDPDGMRRTLRYDRRRGGAHSERRRAGLNEAADLISGVLGRPRSRYLRRWKGGDSADQRASEAAASGHGDGAEGRTRGREPCTECERLARSTAAIDETKPMTTGSRTTCWQLVQAGEHLRNIQDEPRRPRIRADGGASG